MCNCLGLCEIVIQCYLVTAHLAARMFGSLLLLCKVLKVFLLSRGSSHCQLDVKERLRCRDCAVLGETKNAKAAMLIAPINLMLKREERLRLIQFYMLGSVWYNFEKPFLNYFFFLFGVHIIGVFIYC